MSAKTPYSKEWRDRIRPGIQASARVLVPELLTAFPNTHSVVDVGCGEGWWCREFEAAGVRTTGVDGAWVDDVEHVDFENPPYPRLERHDLALCLEVAEHVEAVNARDLVGWLCKLAPTVIFSAAIPGQGGVGHVNEQWPAYWRDLFTERGEVGSGAFRWFIWDDERVEPWYRQNVLVFGDLGPFAADRCVSVVHPGIWSVYR